MAEDLRFLGAVAKGGLIGAFAVSFGFVFYTCLFRREWFADGQYAMMFLITFPLGWLAGSLAGLGLALYAGFFRPPYWIWSSLAIIVGGAIAIPVPGMVFMALLFTAIGLIWEWIKR